MKTFYARFLITGGAMLLMLVSLAAFPAEEKESGYMMTPEQARQMMGGYGYGYGPGYGMGMMGEMGPGMMGGMGYGMMGGPGTMGGMGMMGGPGMMGGMGYGMMGGPGMTGGMGMMGGMGPMWMLDLSDDQETKLGRIMDETRKRQWELMGRMMDEQSGLRDLYAKDKPDPKQVGEAYARIFDLKRQMIENGVAARNSMYDSLTAEQRDELRNWHRGGMPGYGYGRGYGPRSGNRMPMGGGMMGNQ